jgi:hypothetical protein
VTIHRRDDDNRRLALERGKDTKKRKIGQGSEKLWPERIRKEHISDAFIPTKQNSRLFIKRNSELCSGTAVRGKTEDIEVLRSLKKTSGYACAFSSLWPNTVNCSASIS